MKPLIRIALPLILTALYCSDADCQSVSGVVNSYFAITAVNTASNTVTVDNAAGLYNGQPVLIIQMKGATVDASNTATYGSITAVNDAGNYEFNTICSITGNEVWLQNTLVNAYDPTGNVQMVSYTAYSDVTITGTVTAQPWSSTTGKGGVVVVAATNSITLNANIDASGQGFQGGVLENYLIPPYNCDFLHTVSGYFYDDPGSGYNTAGTKGEGIAAVIANEPDGRGMLANGGGGGDNANSGGAGGGNYGAGGAGGTRVGESPFDCHAMYPGIGGASLAAYGYTTGANRVYMGGGGGSGEENNAAGEPGANGGGIIILSAPTIVGGGGELVANGFQPSNSANTDPLQAEGDGGGGGGAGGTIILNATTISGAITALANGGQGSNSSEFVNDCTGPGGGGGGGRGQLPGRGHRICEWGRQWCRQFRQQQGGVPWGSKRRYQRGCGPGAKRLCGSGGRKFGMYGAGFFAIVVFQCGTLAWRSGLGVDFVLFSNDHGYPILCIATRNGLEQLRRPGNRAGFGRFGLLSIYRPGAGYHRDGILSVILAGSDGCVVLFPHRAAYLDAGAGGSVADLTTQSGNGPADAYDVFAGGGKCRDNGLRCVGAIPVFATGLAAGGCEYGGDPVERSGPGGIYRGGGDGGRKAGEGVYKEIGEKSLRVWFGYRHLRVTDGTGFGIAVLFKGGYQNTAGQPYDHKNTLFALRIWFGKMNKDFV